MVLSHRLSAMVTTDSCATSSIERIVKHNQHHIIIVTGHRKALGVNIGGRRTRRRPGQSLAALYAMPALLLIPKSGGPYRFCGFFLRILHRAMMQISWEVGER